MRTVHLGSIRIVGISTCNGREDLLGSSEIGGKNLKRPLYRGLY